MKNTDKAVTGEGKVPRVLNLILPRAEAMMTGVWRILKAHDLVTLEYTDGQRESAIIPISRWLKIRNNTFSIVGEVQSHRVS